VDSAANQIVGEEAFPGAQPGQVSLQSGSLHRVQGLQGRLGFHVPEVGPGPALDLGVEEPNPVALVRGACPVLVEVGVQSSDRGSRDAAAAPGVEGLDVREAQSALGFGIPGALEGQGHLVQVQVGRGPVLP